MPTNPNPNPNPKPEAAAEKAPKDVELDAISEEDELEVDAVKPEGRSAPQGYSQQYHYNSYGHDP